MLNQISDYEIEKSRKILEDHVVPQVSQESALESLLFCISGQVSQWEQSVKFIRNLRLESYSYNKNAIHKITNFNVLTDKDIVNKAARDAGLRFSKQGRFDN